MRRSPLLVAGLLVLMAGCASKESGGEMTEASPEAKPEAAPEAQPVAPAKVYVGELLGGEVVPVPVFEGRYGLRVAYSQKKFITMERTTATSFNGVLSMELVAGGKATACAGLIETQSGSTSKYASHDGKHHRREDESRTLRGFSGTWHHEGPGVRVSFDEVVYRQCATEPHEVRNEPLIELTCFGLDKSETVPLAGLACRLHGESRGQLEDFALSTAGSRAGSWALRTDPVRHGPVPADPDQQPWLLLATDGVRVDSRDAARASKPEVRIVGEAVPFAESDWIEKYVETP